jgi:hypothetical protein
VLLDVVGADAGVPGAGEPGEVGGPGEVLEVDELVEVVDGTPKVTALTTAE